MKNYKSIFALILSILSFGFETNLNAHTRNVKNSASSLSDLLGEAGSSFEKNFGDMNFEKSFEGMIKDRMSFNLGVVAGQKHLGKNHSSHIPQQKIAESVGDFSFIVTRNTAVIAKPLPYVLFGYNDSKSNYIATLSGLIPTGVTPGALATGTNSPGVILPLFNTDAAGNGVFWWNDGTNNDSITVSYVGTNNYTSFLNSQTTNTYASTYTLYSISDVTKLAQFFQSITYGNLSSMGKKDANTLNPNSRKTTIQFQADRVDLITPEYSINTEYSWVQNIINTAGLQINVDLFICKRVNMNNATGIK
jgi:hypothetical protein